MAKGEKDICIEKTHRDGKKVTNNNTHHTRKESMTLFQLNDI